MNTENKDLQKNQEQAMPRYSPSTDIIEREDGFHIFMDMPGVNKEDLYIDLNDNELTISGVSRTEKPVDANNVHMEFGDGEYARSFTISDVVDQEKIKASLKNGVLELIMPKAERAKPRKIEIQAE
ncbi:MAG: Hsp20/alpha crystallin family protein [Thermodesulfobacteriota bacterium]